MGNCANDCSKICGMSAEHGEFNMNVSHQIILVLICKQIWKAYTFADYGVKSYFPDYQ